MREGPVGGVGDGRRPWPVLRVRTADVVAGFVTRHHEVDDGHLAPVTGMVRPDRSDALAG
jgi:hypothetical protein